MTKKPDKETEDYVQNTFAEQERRSSVHLAAFYYRERYEALVMAGFSAQEAMQIIIARGLVI